MASDLVWQRRLRWCWLSQPELRQLMLEPFKYLIQCVAVERDEDGRIVAERYTEPQTAYLPNTLMEIAHNFEQELERMNKEARDGEGEARDGVQGGPVPDRQEAGNLQEARRGHSRRVDAQSVPSGEAA